MNDPTKAALKPRPVGIRGWLTLVAIGFILGPILSVLSFVAVAKEIYELSTPTHAGLYLLDALLHLGVLAFLFYAAALFFGKKSDAPLAIIALIVVSLITTAILLIIELGSGAKEFAAETAKQFARGIIVAAIWIPYFKMSKRVKATFVK